MKLLKAEAGVNDGKAGLLSAAGLFAKGGIFDKKSESFNIQELDPYLLFDARSSMLGTLENPTLDLDPATPSTLDVITATRAGIATYTDSSGLIKAAPANTVRVDYTQGAELTPTVYQHIKYTDFSGLWSTYAYGGASLTKTSGYASPEGNNDAHKFDIVVGTGGVLFTQNATILSSQPYTMSVWMKGEVGGEKVRIDLKNSQSNGVNGSVFTLTNEWQRYELTRTSDATNRGFHFRITASDNASDQTFYAYGPQLEEGTTASSFVENTTGSPKFTGISATYAPRVPMILCEPSATNLLTATQEVSSWSSTNVSVTSNTTTAPDGSQTGDTVTRTAGGADVRQTKAVTSGTSYTMSIFAKAETDNQIQLDFSNSRMGADNVEFNTRTGQKVIGSNNYTITELSNGWRRYSFTSTCILSGTTGVIIKIKNDEPVQLWGFQFEEGSFATSYIPHISGSTVTRAADDLVITGSAFSSFFNGSEGTFYIEAIDREVSGGDHAYIAGQGTSQFFLYKNNAVTSVNNYDGVNGLALTGLVSNQLFRAAASYNSSVKSLSFNGATVSGNARASGGFDVANVLKIGSGYTNVFSGHYRRIIYWPYHSDSL